MPPTNKEGNTAENAGESAPQGERTQEEMAAAAASYADRPLTVEEVQAALKDIGGTAPSEAQQAEAPEIPKVAMQAETQEPAEVSFEDALADAGTLEELAELFTQRADERRRFQSDTGTSMDVDSTVGYLKRLRDDPSLLNYIYDSRLKARAEALLAQTQNPVVEIQESAAQVGAAEPSPVAEASAETPTDASAGEGSTELPPTPEEQAEQFAQMLSEVSTTAELIDAIRNVPGGMIKMRVGPAMSGEQVAASLESRADEDEKLYYASSVNHAGIGQAALRLSDARRAARAEAVVPEAQEPVAEAETQEPAAQVGAAEPSPVAEASAETPTDASASENPAETGESREAGAPSVEGGEAYVEYEPEPVSVEPAGYRQPPESMRGEAQPERRMTHGERVAGWMQERRTALTTAQTAEDLIQVIKDCPERDGLYYSFTEPGGRVHDRIAIEGTSEAIQDLVQAGPDAQYRKDIGTALKIADYIDDPELRQAALRIARAKQNQA